MAKMRVLSVSDVQIHIEKSNPPQVAVMATGQVGTPGWTGAELKPMETELSADGILDLEFIGEPPTGIVIQVVTPISANIVWKKDVDRLVGVKVHTRTNDITRLVSQSGPDLPTTPAIGEEGGAGSVTTFALGEEAPTTVFPGGEVPFPTTFPLGEQGPKTLQVGEEGTSFVIAEEGKPLFGETSPTLDDPTGPFGEDNRWPWTAGFRNPFGSR